jgi:hypothetical protein
MLSGWLPGGALLLPACRPRRELFPDRSTEHLPANAVALKKILVKLHSADQMGVAVFLNQDCAEGLIAQS